MSNQHLFKAQIFELYVKSVFPDCVVTINNTASDQDLFFTVMLFNGSLTWNAQFAYSDQDILYTEFKDIMGYDYLSGKYDGRKEYENHIYDMPECQITFSQFVVGVEEMVKLSDLLLKDIYPFDSVYSRNGFAHSISVAGYGTLTVDPNYGVWIEYLPTYKDICPDVKNEGRDFICTYEQFNENREHYIGVVRSTLMKIKTFDFEHKKIIDDRMVELKTELTKLAKEIGL
jgi:hypothetical protein